jgi:hypothetical protein
MPYRWEPNAGASGRYRDERGRFVASSTVRRELDRYLDNSDPAKALAEALRGRQLSLADWEVAMRRHVKNTQLNAIALERGGWANMTPADYGRAGQIIREQYGYLRGFANDIASGKQRLDGTLGVRARLYTQAGRESFYRSKQANLTAGVDMVRSVRHARDSCSECVSLDGKWFRVGDPTYKLPGQRICTKNCRCTEEYGRQTADGVEVVNDGEQAAPAPIRDNWRPSMTKDEAEAWSADSAFKESVYHGTSKKRAGAITESGFNWGEQISGRYYGDGAYFVYGKGSKASAGRFSEIATRQETGEYSKGKVLEARLNVPKIKDLSSPGAFDRFVTDELMPGLNIQDRGAVRSHHISSYLSANGYPAMMTRETGVGQILVVFDPKVVTVIK